MTSILKQYGTAIILLITAIIIIVVSLWTHSKTAWAYILAVGFLVAAFWEMYSRKNKGKGQ